MFGGHDKDCGMATMREDKNSRRQCCNEMTMLIRVELMAMSLVSQVVSSLIIKGALLSVHGGPRYDIILPVG